MSLSTEKPRLVQAPVPILRYDSAAASYAFDAHKALLNLEHRVPGLADNPAWNAIRAFAYRQFERAYEAPL